MKKFVVLSLLVSQLAMVSQSFARSIDANETSYANATSESKGDAVNKDSINVAISLNFDDMGQDQCRAAGNTLKGVLLNVGDMAKKELEGFNQTQVEGMTEQEAKDKLLSVTTTLEDILIVVKNSPASQLAPNTALLALMTTATAILGRMIQGHCFR